MDFSLTDEQKALPKLASDYVARHVRPVVAGSDRNPNLLDCIPSDVVEEGSKLGLRRLSLEVHGGLGYMRECPVEKYLRYVISFFHGAGNNHIYRIKISSRITGLPAEMGMPSGETVLQ